MSVIFVLLLLFLVVLLVDRVIRQVHGNYLLSIFQFLISFCVLYGFGLYDAQSAISELHGSGTLPLCWAGVLIGLAGIAVGYRVFPVSRIRRWPHLRVRAVPSRLGSVGAALVVVGVAGELFFIRQSGGAEAYFSTGRGAGSFDGATAYVYGARWLWVPGIAFLVGAGMERPKWRLFGIAALTMFGLYNFALGQRTGVFLAILLAVYTRAVWSRRIPKARTVVVAVTVAGVLIGFVKLTRRDFYLGSHFPTVHMLLDRPPGEVIKESLLANLSDPGRGYGETSEIVLFAGFIRVIPGMVDYDYFKYYTSFLYAWIPRIVWPSRPDPTREKVSELVAVLGTSHRSGPTPTILGMYYLHFGFVSVFALSVLTGLFLALIDAHGRVAFVNSSAAVVFVSTAGMGLSMPMGLGPLASVPTLLPFTVVPVVTGLWWAQQGAHVKEKVRHYTIQRLPTAAASGLLQGPAR